MARLDDLTFVIRLREPFAVTSLGFGQTLMIMKGEIAGRTSPDDSVDVVAASGPWRLTNWTPGFRFDLEPREGFSPGIYPEGERVHLDALEIVEISDSAMILVRSQDGQDPLHN